MLALLADVHANLEALEAVLRDIDARAPGARLVCAGDLVGYGPDPGACLARVLERDPIVARGNHEEMVLGWRDDSHCVAAGILAVAWTRRRLARPEVSALRRLPGIAEVDRELVVCHGAPDDAGVYVSDAAAATRSLDRMRAQRPRARLLVCGHTHMPMCFSRARGLVSARDDETIRLDDADEHLVNPGAVGQARDGVRRARYALFDRERSRLTFHSVPYDHETTIAKLRDAGLVARVTLTPPRGARRHVENVKAKAARLFVRIPARMPVRASLRASALDLRQGSLGAELEAPSLKRRLLQVAAGAVHASAGEMLGGPGAVILAYRGIASSDDAPFLDPRHSIPFAVFERQMELLATQRRVFALGDLVDKIARGAPIPPGSAVITFDGGSLSTLHMAAPVLARHGLDALVFLPTGHITRAKPQLSDSLYRAFVLRSRQALALPFLPEPVDLRDRRAALGAFLASEAHLSRAPAGERDEVLGSIEEQLRPEGPAPRSTMTWDEVHALVRLHPRIAVGVHTRDCVDLSSCDDATVRAELAACIGDVRAATGRDPAHLSFPFGRCSARARALVRATSLLSASVMEPAGLVGLGADPFELPRLKAPSTMARFAFLTSGVLRRVTSSARSSP